MGRSWSLVRCTGQVPPAQQERIERLARVYRTALSALAALSDEELDSIGQVAVEEAQKSTSPITMARVVLQLSPSRRVQLMNILVQENVLEDASALRLFRALSALESILGTDTLDAVLTGMDGCASATAGLVDLGSGVMSAGASVLDSVAQGATSSMDALGSWTAALWGSQLQDGEDGEVGVTSPPEVPSASRPPLGTEDGPQTPQENGQEGRVQQQSDHFHESFL
eukprot:Skav208413  [mRNA]  locus=scaffold2953:124846:125970:+ [translate_table: standard]